MMDKLYSVCGYRTNKDFEKLHEWTFDQNTYELYGKKTGKKDKENTFKLPSSIEEKYYGSLCIVKHNGSISLDEWNIFYMSMTTISEKHTQIDDSNSCDTSDCDLNENKNFKNTDFEDFEDVGEPELELTYEEYEEE